MQKLLTEEQLRSRVKELAEMISRDYEGKVPIFIGVLNGSFIFLADLIRELSIECEVDFIKLASYEAGKSIGTVHLLKDISADITGRDVIIAEDIVDTGLTISFLKTRMADAGPASLKIVTLLFKKEVARLNFDLDYVGFEIPPGFVVGYGLDYNQKMRNLRAIFTINE
ncbi:MAG: hypoxanthine phosphoribosyltransferase [Candidatus Neomarinimicrobiota bacterium]